MRRLSLLLAVFVLAPPAAASSAAADATTFRYRVVGAVAAARLDFRGGDGLRFSEGRATLAARLARLPKARPARVSLSSRGGRVLVPLVLTRFELVATSTRAAPTNPYSEPRVCRDRKASKARGGLLLSRAGRRILVRWAFPTAKLSFCPSPGRLGRAPTAKTVARIPSARLGAKRLTLPLSGTARIATFPYASTYRWRARVTLVRS